MRMQMIRQRLEEIAHRRKAIRRHAESALARREAILDDPVYAGPHARPHRDRAIQETRDEATARIAAERDGIREAATWIEDYELRGERGFHQSPGPAGQAAAQRVHSMLDAGVHLRDVLQQSADANDQPALEYLQSAIRGLVAEQIAKADPHRVDTAETKALAANMYERLVNTRWEHMGVGEHDYHETRRAVAGHLAGAERDAAFWTKVGRDTVTPTDKLAYGFATQEPWASVTAEGATGTWDDSAGPVEQPVGIAADA